MTLKVKTELKLSGYDRLKRVLKSGITQEIGLVTIREMKDQIARGNSPVRGFRRFKAYSSQRGNPNGYPRNVTNEFPNKKVRPVNLNLSGNMLGSLTFKRADYGATVGIFDSREAEKAKRHQLGVPEDNLPQRRFIPADNGERFLVSIEQAIKDTYSKLIDKILK